MALPASQYRTFRDLLRIMLSIEGVGPSDGDVLSFFKQLLADSSGAVALSTSRSFLCGQIFKRILSGNSSNPTDADVVTFWTQFASDSSSAVAMGQTVSYQRMRQALRGSISCDGLNPTDTDVLSYFATYSTTNPTAILGSAPAWWVDASAGTLTDAGGGLCSAWGASPGTTVGFTAAGAGRPLIITNGLNSRNTVRFTSSNFMTATFQSPVPGTTPSYFWFVLNITNIASSRVINAGADADQAIYNATGSLRDYCGSNGPQSPVLTASFVFLECFRSNSATDYLTINGVVGSQASATNGAATSAILTLNAGPGGVSGGNSEIAEAGQWFGADPGTTKRNAMRAYVTAKWGV